jgi:hypothetical protein
MLKHKRVILIAFVVVLLGIFVATFPRGGASLAPTQQPAGIPTTPPLFPRPTPLAFSGAVGAFDCGSGNYIGAIEPGRPYEELGRQGDLVEVEVEGSGRICVRKEELP